MKGVCASWTAGCDLASNSRRRSPTPGALGPATSREGIGRGRRRGSANFQNPLPHVADVPVLSSDMFQQSNMLTVSSVHRRFGHSCCATETGVCFDGPENCGRSAVAVHRWPSTFLLFRRGSSPGSSLFSRPQRFPCCCSISGGRCPCYAGCAISPVQVVERTVKIPQSQLVEKIVVALDFLTLIVDMPVVCNNRFAQVVQFILSLRRGSSHGPDCCWTKRFTSCLIRWPMSLLCRSSWITGAVVKETAEISQLLLLRNRWLPVGGLFTALHRYRAGGRVHRDTAPIIRCI